MHHVHYTLLHYVMQENIFANYAIIFGQQSQNDGWFRKYYRFFSTVAVPPLVGQSISLRRIRETPIE